MNEIDFDNAPLTEKIWYAYLYQKMMRDMENVMEVIAFSYLVCILILTLIFVPLNLKLYLEFVLILSIAVIVATCIAGKILTERWIKKHGGEEVKAWFKYLIKEGWV